MSLPTTERAVIVEEARGPEVLQYCTDHPIPTPQEGQVLVKNRVSGINYIDTYFREALYPSPKPEVLGREATSTIVALGPGAEAYGLAFGDRLIGWEQLDMPSIRWFQPRRQ